MTKKQVKMVLIMIGLNQIKKNMQQENSIYNKNLQLWQREAADWCAVMFRCSGAVENETSVMDWKLKHVSFVF
jgi:hypothetical protein